MSTSNWQIARIYDMDDNMTFWTRYSGIQQLRQPTKKLQHIANASQTSAPNPWTSLRDGCTKWLIVSVAAWSYYDIGLWDHRTSHCHAARGSVTRSGRAGRRVTDMLSERH